MGGKGSGRRLDPEREKAVLRARIQLEKDERVKGGMRYRIKQIEDEQRQAEQRRGGRKK